MFQNKTIIITAEHQELARQPSHYLIAAGANVYILDKKKLIYDASTSIHYLACDVSNADAG